MKLEEALNLAIRECHREDDEEAGGVILEKDGEYEFIQLKNYNTGQDLARSLWTADRYEFSKLVYPKLFAKDGKWTQYGSFHTHPRYSAHCSDEDVRSVFKAYPNNFIYGGRDKMLVKYYWDGKELRGKKVKYYGDN